VVLAEFVGSTTGMGYLMITALATLNATDMFAAVTLLSVVGTASCTASRSSNVLHWWPEFREKRTLVTAACYFAAEDFTSARSECSPAYGDGNAADPSWSTRPHPFWLSTFHWNFAVPRVGSFSDEACSSTAERSRSASPGLTGLHQRNLSSPGDPMQEDSSR
jgi:hypothetical protein